MNSSRSGAPELAPLPLPWPESEAPLAERVSLYGWNGYLLANDLVRLVAVPSIGGRIMALDLRAPAEDADSDHSFVWIDSTLAGKLFSAEENMGDGSLGAWKNYGGDKTWPAPQGWSSDAEWHGPPDPVLDTGHYRVEEFGPKTGNGGGVTLKMVSPPDARTGLQISRTFVLEPGSSRVEVLLGFRNASSRPVCWSIWDVIQLNAGRTVEPDTARGSSSAVGGKDYDPSCVVTAPTGEGTAEDPPFHVMFGSPENPQWSVEQGLFFGRYLWQIGKVGVRSPGSWVAFNQGSQSATFVERFSVDPSGHYPDDGSTIEVWTIGSGDVGNLNYEGSGIYLMEVEVLSPLQTIEPGREVRFALTWGVCRCTGPVLHSEDGGCSVERLYAVRELGGMRLRGRFGLFDEGKLELAWINGHDMRLGSLPLDRSAGPTAEFALDMTVTPPSGASAVELWQRSRGGARRVDMCKLPVR